ncbi:MutS domain V [Caminicella sporogenes DSM 14501]|uniref:MutS domain V n=1 Tax=Caminicella sporogenes DSM 14501 TaxID=1121266 RepID=A0A1M6PQ66_9FIRM|nr:DNA mismatch repair protein MutS [Caminicella sporogenes]RKD22023.1 DNA mismatch repair protein MutS [Caminicella sporogenes]SHK09998.1 MutS domain V [Caminicella sporogenes DSM 14501]
MFISKESAENLDLDFVFDKLTVYTPYGENLKKNIRPFRKGEKEQLNEELNRIEKIVGLIKRQRYTVIEIRNYFKHIKDLTLTFQRVKDDEVLSVIELYEIKLFVGILSKLYLSIQKLNWDDMPDDIKPMPIPEIENLLDPQKTGTTTFYIYDEYSEKLASIRKEIKEIENKINIEKKKLKAKVEDELGLKLRPTGEIIISKDKSELIEKLKSHDLLLYSMETYMNVTFKLRCTEYIDEMTLKIQDLKELEEEEEFKVREYLSREIKKYIDIIEKNISAIGKLDLLMAKGYHAVGFGGVRPDISDKEGIYILNGRHIKVEQNLRKEGKEFTPITVNLKKGVTCITGANMGGKTVALKLIGMLSAMAQYGLFVPAEKMKFSLKEYIFFSLGDMQSTDMGLSTFGGEIMKIKEAIKFSHKSGLILIDELARGTNPKEGFAISKALINYLKKKNAITVITTHFDGLTLDKDIKHLQVKGISEKKFEEISQKLLKGKIGIETLHHYMDYRLEEVDKAKEVPKDAIRISRLMGLDEEILKDAEKILKDNE